MDDKINHLSVYSLTENVVAREIEGELILVPLTSGIADLEDDLFTLNETGKVIWEKLDGQRSVQSIIEDLSEIYEDATEIEEDVKGFLTELLKRKIIVETKVG